MLCVEYGVFLLVVIGLGCVLAYIPVVVGDRCVGMARFGRVGGAGLWGMGVGGGVVGVCGWVWGGGGGGRMCEVCIGVYCVCVRWVCMCEVCVCFASLTTSRFVGVF